MKPAKKRRKTRPARPLTLLQQLAAVPEKLFTGAFRQQYAALCFRYADGGTIEILLVTSRTSGRWIIPRGWPMKRKKPHQAAAIEAWEEAGVRGRVRRKNPLERGYRAILKVTVGTIADFRETVKAFPVKVRSGFTSGNASE